MEKKAFKVGDKIKNSPTGVHGIVMGFVGGKYVQIKSPAADFYTTWDIADCELSEAYDPKTAFLTELKNLLDKYNAGIYVGFNRVYGTYDTTIVFGEDRVEYSNIYGINADNVFNYDK